MTEDNGAMARFLTRNLPPCPVEGCDGQPRADFINLTPGAVGNPGKELAVKAVYRCDDCGALWDHKGQPLTDGDNQ